MKYFGTDGIRGKYNEVITNNLAYKLGRSLIHLNCNKVVVGIDTRESGVLLSNAFISGCLSVGVEVINGGVIPTSALIYYSKINNIYGVMITASHNPYYDNGLKIVNNGVKLSYEEELLIESLLEEDVKVENYDSVLVDPMVEELYYKLINSYITKTNLKIVIDCANGATYKTATNVFSKVTSNLEVLANTPNGTNINESCGSTHLDNLNKINNYDIAFSFDGDGDRVLVVENNKVIDGDQIIYIIARYLKDNHALNNNTVVLTIMSNIGILKAFDKLDIFYKLTSVGDKHVVRELVKNNYSIGGENSGHIILPEILPTGDGVLVSLLLIKIMNEYNSTLSDLLSDIKMYEDKMVNLEVSDKTIINTNLIKNEIAKISNSIDGKVIVRASGTENLIRISVMAKTKIEVENNIIKLVKLIGG